MGVVISYIRAYYAQLHKGLFLACLLFTALMVFLNYRYGLETWLVENPNLPASGFSGKFILFLVCFGIPYLLTDLFLRKKNILNPGFLGLFLVSVILFSIKAGHGLPGSWFLEEDRSSYWGYVLYWPARLLLVLLVVGLFWDRAAPRYFGLVIKTDRLRPYLYMLLLMIPLILFASTQADFLAMYPKMKVILPYLAGDSLDGMRKLLFELSYGSDFVGIEVFFRGFLIFIFGRYAGKDAILPMACFYCSIHFGKPFFECISSFGGGLLLGIVSYHSRSVSGGLLVHLGIAWMMELGGYAGNMLLQK